MGAKMEREEQNMRRDGLQEMPFLKLFENKVKNTIKEFKLLNKKDNVVVACSGGKDSTTILYLLNKFDYNVQALFIDTGIPHSSEENRNNLQDFCERYGIKLNVVSLKEEYGGTLGELRARKANNLTNCALCGILKRHLLNEKARILGATKLVTGHNLNDEVENILLNIFGGNMQISLGLGPKSGVTNDKKFVPKVKPLYYCTNEETKNYSKLMNWNIVYCDCPFNYDAFRKIVRKIIKRLELEDSMIKENMIKNFLKILPELRKSNLNNYSIFYCSICGEPSRNNKCKKCEILN
ncbi:MAG: adenine nucleotide alpha hydrolase family protein [Nanoarchaeota archaeon]|nr:adenine nucleotide alpha hydrolase family protein [Nanoarchaeota archaeon]